jgi:hypothetical protein
MGRLIGGAHRIVYIARNGGPTTSKGRRAGDIQVTSVHTGMSGGQAALQKFAAFECWLARAGRPPDGSDNVR